MVRELVPSPPPACDLSPPPACDLSPPPACDLLDMYLAYSMTSRAPDFFSLFLSLSLSASLPLSLSLPPSHPPYLPSAISLTCWHILHCALGDPVMKPPPLPAAIHAEHVGHFPIPPTMLPLSMMTRMQPWQYCVEDVSLPQHGNDALCVHGRLDS
jgi:hypothetical protein